MTKLKTAAFVAIALVLALAATFFLLPHMDGSAEALAILPNTF